MRAFIAIVLMISVNAFGATVSTFKISGNVSSVWDPNNMLGDDIFGGSGTTSGVGTSWTGRLSYDSSLPDIKPLNPKIGAYRHQAPLGVIGVSITVNGLTFKTDSSQPFFISVYNDLPTGGDVQPFVDKLIAMQPWATSSIGTIDLLSLNLTDWTASSLVTDALPTELQLNNRLRGNISVGHGPNTKDVFISFEITELTPVTIPDPAPGSPGSYGAP